MHNQDTPIYPLNGCKVGVMIANIQPKEQPMADQEKQLKFRVSTALHEAISAQAARDTRTLQGEIIVLLKEALRARGVEIHEEGQAPKRGVAVMSPVMAG